MYGEFIASFTMDDTETAEGGARFLRKYRGNSPDIKNKKYKKEKQLKSWRIITINKNVLKNRYNLLIFMFYFLEQH